MSSQKLLAFRLGFGRSAGAHAFIVGCLYLVASLL